MPAAGARNNGRRARPDGLLRAFPPIAPSGMRRAFSAGKTIRVTDAVLTSSHRADQSLEFWTAVSAAAVDPVARSFVESRGPDSSRGHAEWRPRLQSVRQLRRASERERDVVRGVRAKAQRSGTAVLSERSA